MNTTNPMESGLGVNLVGVVNVLLRRRRTIFAVTLVLELVLLVVALQRPLRYSATVAFMPESQRQASGVSSLAAQFGVAVPASDGLNSPLFYPELVRSPQFLSAIVDSQYLRDSTGQGGRNLIEIFGIPGSGSATARALAVQRLQRDVVISPAQRTGIVTITVSAQSAILARDIAERILAEITKFNQHTRQGRASAERRFVERRLAEVRDSARATEGRLREFLLENRDYRTSPTLALRFAALQRDVESQQLLLATLGPSYEQARIEEVRDTPVLTIIRRPEAPVWPDPRGRLLLMVIGLLVGLLLGAGVVLAREWLASLRSVETPETGELKELTRGITADLRDRRFLRALFGGGPKA